VKFLKSILMYFADVPKYIVGGIVGGVVVVVFGGGAYVIYVQTSAAKHPTAIASMSPTAVAEVSPAQTARPTSSHQSSAPPPSPRTASEATPPPSPSPPPPPLVGITCSSNPNPAEQFSTVTASDPSNGRSPYSFIWDFGDDSSASIPDQGQTVRHGWPNDGGTFNPVAHVTDSFGSRGACTFVMHVIRVPNFVGASVSPTSGNAPLTVTWHVDLQYGVAPYKLCWGIMTPQSDGTIVESIFYSNGQDLTQTLTASGTYQLVRLRITDANGVSIIGGETATVRVGSSGPTGGQMTNGCE